MKFVTATELAEQLGITPRQVQRLAPTVPGGFRAHPGQRAPWLFPAEEAKKFIADWNKRKRPEPTKGKGR